MCQRARVTPLSHLTIQHTCWNLITGHCLQPRCLFGGTSLSRGKHSDLGGGSAIHWCTPCLNACRLVEKQKRHPHAQLRLPVLLCGVAVQDGRLVLDAVHYPALLRYYDWYKGRPVPLPQIKHDSQPAAGACRVQLGTQSDAGNREACLVYKKQHPGISCVVAGLQDVQPQAQQLLQQYIAGEPTRVQQLRVFAVTQQQDTANSPHMAQSASNTATHAMDATKQQQQQQMPAALQHLHSNDRHKLQPSLPIAAQAGHQVSAAGRTHDQQLLAPKQLPNTSATDQTLQIWAEVWARGLPTSALKAASAAVTATAGHTDNCDAIPAASAAPGTGGASIHVSVSRWPFSRSSDVTHQLLRHGLARIVPQEDFEWLGVRSSVVKAYMRAHENAKRKCVGIHAAPGTPSTAWSAVRRHLSWLRPFTSWTRS